MGKGALSASSKHSLVEKGWAVIGAKDRKALDEVRAALTRKARDLTGQPKLELEDFHYYAKDEPHFVRWVKELTHFFQSEKWDHRVIESERELFQKLLGPDLDIQAKSALWIARPGFPKDNIAFRRDTIHGHQPQELSVLVPYGNIPEASAISVISGSHLSEVKPSFDNAEAIPLKLGEILVFSQALLYGSQANVGEHTRWTSDTRIVSSGIAKRPDREEGFYVDWCRSAELPPKQELT